MGKLTAMKPRKGVRARKADGTLKADDPSTPDINEAWEGGKAPVKRKTPKKKRSKVCVLMYKRNVLLAQDLLL